MRRHLFLFASLLVAGCGLEGQDNDRDTETAAAAQPVDNEADAMASRDGETAPDQIADAQDRPIMQAQVVLDRRGFGPGVIDGKMGMSTENALLGFQEANGIDQTGKLDAATKAALADWENIPATRVVTIPEEWGTVAFEEIPDDPAAQAEMERLGYTSLDEKLAERFHTTVAVLKMLNPGGKPASSSPTADETPVGEAARSASDDAGPASEASADGKGFFRAGQQIRVPNIGADRIAPGAIGDEGWKQTLAMLGVGSEQPDVDRIVVSEKAGTLKGYDADDKLVVLFTVTSGSSNDPLPLGEWGINGVGRNPEFSYDPDLFWDVPDSNPDLMMPPGPNNPVGVVWIDLTKEHYGIHGTPEPQTIGRTQSHGCVRLTNWDAARLAQMVSTGTQVVFEA